MKIVKQYAGQGYETYFRPRPEDLPSFARDFNVDILANGGPWILVQVKRNRDELAGRCRHSPLCGYHEQATGMEVRLA